MTGTFTQQSVRGGSLPSVSFIIPVRDDAERLRQCLVSIRANDYPAEAVEVIVVDNGSQDGSSEVATAAGARVLCKPGLQVGELRNEGVRAAMGEIVVFVDADHIIDPNWLAYAAERFKDPAVGAIGSPYLAPPDGTWVQRAYGRLRGRVIGVREVEWLGTGNLAIRRQVFEGLRGFDTSLHTCEDVDLCNRLRANGYQIVSDERLRSIHLGDPATLPCLFLSELWRGRDNLRVTFRAPITLRALPSVLFPIFNLFLMGLAIIGIPAAPWGGAWLAPASLLGLASLGFLRAIRMVRSHPGNAGWRHLIPDFAVACTYEVARSLALIWRATHKTRRVQLMEGHHAPHTNPRTA